LGRWLSCDPRAREQLGARPEPRDDRDADDRAPSRTPKHRPDPAEDEAPSEAEPCEPKELNPYAYVAQNPLLYSDPTGEVGIIQAWWNGYKNASDCGKVGYGFLFIFAWLLHVIVNLVVLALSVTLFNAGGFFGLLDFTYGGVQSILGLGAGIVMTLLGADVTPQAQMGARVELPAYMGRLGGMSLGPVVLGTAGFKDWSHEFGHTWQSRALGPLYLLIVALPSLFSATRSYAVHKKFYTERWADAWAP
jgi:hypothetical protein